MAREGVYLIVLWLSLPIDRNGKAYTKQHGY